MKISLANHSGQGYIFCHERRISITFCKLNTLFAQRLTVFTLIGSLAFLPLTGCKYSASVSVSYNSQTGATTTTVTGIVSSNVKVSSLTLSDFTSNSSSGFKIIASAPSTYFSLNPNTPPQSTFTAVTDTGYTSSVTVNLHTVTSTALPVTTGDKVFTFAVTDTDALNTWIANVAANTTSTLQLTSTSSMPLLCSATSGTYVVSVEISSTATGLIKAGSASININAKDVDTCKSGQMCTE